tara:strand:- start:28 stop:909 length:882 start_codon:yes stop_codon:yes gene_type:complete
MPYLGARPTDVFADRDLNGQEFILDADADTSITADTDDQIDIRIAGADDFQLTANTFTVLSGSTLAVASGATIANSGTATGFSASTLDAATTVGDGTAEDTKIVFDGNAQDYYIGLDDTDDDLKIGLGSTVGTTAHIVIDETGAILKPLQPAFHGRRTGANANQTGDGTQYTVPFDGAETFDQNADFDGTTFTAPVAGVYLLTYALGLSGITTSHTNGRVELKTSNRDYRQNRVDPTIVATGDNWSLQGAVIADMDASDTAYVTIIIGGGAKVVDFSVDGTAAYTYFSGCLLV